MHTLACIQIFLLWQITVKSIKQISSGAETKAFFGKTRFLPKLVPPNVTILLLRRCAHGTSGFSIIGVWHTSHRVIVLSAIMYPAKSRRSTSRRRSPQAMFVRLESPVILSDSFTLTKLQQLFTSGYGWVILMRGPINFIEIRYCFFLIHNILNCMSRFCGSFENHNGLFRHSWKGGHKLLVYRM